MVFYSLVAPWKLCADSITTNRKNDPIVVVKLVLPTRVCLLRDGGEDGHDPAGRGDNIQGSRGLPEDRERHHQARRLR